MASNRIYLQVDLDSTNAQQNVNAINKGIAQLGPSAEKSSEQATRGLQRVSVSVESVGRSFNELGQALAGLGLARAVTSLIQFSSEMERIQRAMTTFTGSGERAAKVFEQVRQLAAQSGAFGFKDLEESARQLLAFGAAADKVPAYLKAITDQVAAFGGGMGEVNDMIRIFGRIMAKDFVGAMDLFRGMGAKGIEITEALRAALSKEWGRPVGLEEFQQALQNKALDPLATWEVLLQAAQKRTKDFDKNTQDAAGAFHRLGTEIQKARDAFGEAFDKAFANLAREITNILSPIAALLDYLEKLPEPTKQLIVNLAAITAGVVAFGAAWRLAKTIAVPAIDLITLSVKALGKALLFALANPELVLALTAITLVLGSLYLFVPQVTKAVDDLWQKLKGKFTGWSKEIQKAMGLEDVIPTDKLSRESEKGLDELQKRVDKFAAEAGEAILKAFDAPVEAVTIKYAKAFQDLNRDIASAAFAITPEHATKLREQLGIAQSQEERAAGLKQRKRELEEFTRFQVEQVKGSTDAQVAYIEAQDAQTLRGKVAAIDRITELRIQAENQVAEIQKQHLETEFADFEKFVTDSKDQLLAAGLTQQQINDMVLTHRQEMERKAGLVEQKAADEMQKYRLEGWKKANDAIIEDQKRVYDAFKSEFDQLFDAFTDKTKSLGQALGDFFKKTILGEAKELFSSQLAATATQVAGYGRPEETITRGQGIVGVLLRRGMPPRPPLPPPGLFSPIGTEENVKGYQELVDSANAQRNAADDLSGSADDLKKAAEALAAVPSTAEFRETVGGGRMDFGSQFRRYITGGPSVPITPPTNIQGLIDQAAAQYGLPPALLRAVAQTESGYRPRAVSGAGAVGIMQLMPGTAAEMGVTAPFNPTQNIFGGARYLRQMLDQFGGNIPRALMAYNAGPYGGTPPAARQYASNVTTLMRAMAPQPTIPTAAEVSAAPPGTPMAAVPAAAVAAPFLHYAQARAFTLPQAMAAELPLAPALLPTGGGAPPVNSLLKLLGLGGAMPAAPGAAGGGGAGLMQQLWNLPLGKTPLTGLAASAAGLPALFGIGTAMGGSMGMGGGQVPLGMTAPPGSPLAQVLTNAGINIRGTSLSSILSSKGAGALESFAGMALLSAGLRQRLPAATALGGGLAGLGTVAMNPALLSRMASMGFGTGASLGLGAAAGIGAGVFASGVQRGGGLGVAMDIGGGALAGAAIGTMFLPGLGTAIGAAIGAGVGAITGVVRLFVKTEQERIRQQIKQVYGIDISNRQILQQIQQIIDQKYGGSVSIGIRSQEVQDIVRLFALSQGKAANLPRPMYAATVAEAGGGLALQPVYQGGQLVQNPYTGPTTYQYQTAVTSALALKAGTSQGVPGATGLIQNTFLQLNAQQAQALMTGQVVSAIQSNPSAVASAGASAARAGDSRMTTTAAMTSPLTALP